MAGTAAMADQEVPGRGGQARLQQVAQRAGEEGPPGGQVLHRVLADPVRAGPGGRHHPRGPRDPARGDVPEEVRKADLESAGQGPQPRGLGQPYRGLGRAGAAAAPAGRQVGQEELLPAALLDLALALQPPGHRGHV